MGARNLLAAARALLVFAFCCIGSRALLATPCAGEFTVGDSTLAAADCELTWVPTFGGMPGTDSGINALAVFDDGSGAALYSGGSFSSAGGAQIRSIARWDGTSWSSVGDGLFGTVWVLEVLDDGSGPALYAGGSGFDLSKWDGVAWTQVGPDLPGRVYALEVFDDGSGPALYAGGAFVNPLQNLHRIAKFDGTNWVGLAGGVNNDVRALAVFDDGSGAALYIGGEFQVVDGQFISKLVAWDGAAFTALTVPITANTVRALTVFDDGTGTALYAGGSLGLANGIARYDGSSWSNLAGGLDNTVEAITVFDDGTGPALYASGQFAMSDGEPGDGIARWDGAAWSALGEGLEHWPVKALAASHGGELGTTLFAGGLFSWSGLLQVRRVAAWDGNARSSVGNGLSDEVRALAAFDDGSGEALYVGGSFRQVGSADISRIARWEDGAWSPLGMGLNNTVHALLAHESLDGPVLYAAGEFSAAGGQTAGRVAAWDGTSWSSLGAGLTGTVRALAIHDDGSGPALYAGGEFMTAAGAPASRVARWDGTSWSSLGSGVNDTVWALVSHDDGGGAKLFVGGEFTQAGGAPASKIAAWDGQAWSNLAGGMAPSPGATQYGVRSLATFDVGNGAALYAGGWFDRAGGVPCSRVARWNGSAWSHVGQGLGSLVAVQAFAVLDVGEGPALFAAGGGSDPLRKFDGASWVAVDTDMDTWIRALAVHDDGQGTGLFAGGQFTFSPGGDSFVAKLARCGPAVGVVFCTGSASVCPCGNPGGAETGCANSSGVGATIAASGSASSTFDDLGVLASGLLPGQFALLIAGEATVNGGIGAPFGAGLRCVGSHVVRLGVRASDGLGAATWGPGIVSQCSAAPGSVLRLQVWYRDPAAGSCGGGFNLSHGLGIDIVN